MNKSIITLHDAVAYQLEGLLYAESTLASEFALCRKQLSSPDVIQVLEGYMANALNVKLKLERVFNHLMHDPHPRRNRVIDKMIEETQRLLTAAREARLKDILMVGCVRSINAYKTSVLQTAHLITVELELDVAGDLVNELLVWEHATAKKLGSLFVREFNAFNGIVKT